MIGDTDDLLWLLGYGIVGFGMLLGAMQTMTTPQTNNTSSLPRNVNILARTCWGEARGEGYQGMQAVADVVLNRVKAGDFPGGSDIASVCLAHNQFSCWNLNDPNRAKVVAVTEVDTQFAIAVSIAKQAVNGTLADIVHGATFYHASSIPTPQSWGKVYQVAEIGNHIFYVQAKDYVV